MPIKTVFAHTLLLVLIVLLFLKGNDQKNKAITEVVESKKSSIGVSPKNEIQSQKNDNETMVNTDSNSFSSTETDVENAKHPGSMIAEQSESIFKHQDVERPTIPQAPANMQSIYSGSEGMVYYQCQKEGVRILPDAAQVTLTGDCLYVDVLGPKSHINIQQTNVLKVSAPEAQVSVNRVDYIEVNGPSTQVYYRTSLEKSQTITIVRGPNAFAQRR